MRVMQVNEMVVVVVLSRWGAINIGGLIWRLITSRRVRNWKAMCAWGRGINMMVVMMVT